MTSMFFTPKEIIEIHEKVGGGSMLKLLPEKTKSNKNAKFPTNYIPFQCVDLQGKYKPLSLKTVKQVIASSAKLTQGADEEKAKEMNVMFRSLTEDDLKQTDYKTTDYADLLKRNDELVAALDILADEYLHLVEDEVKTYTGSKFDAGGKDKIFCFRQSHRKATPEDRAEDLKRPADERVVKNGKVKLPINLYRIKIPVDVKTGKLGRYFDKKGHQYVVFDARKATKENKFQPVPAKVKENGKFEDLTVTNAKNFITYMSLTAGVIDFDSICISSSGISCLNRYRDFHVMPHKILKIITMDENDASEMALAGTSSFDDNLDVANIEDPDNDMPGKKKTTKSSKSSKKSKTRSDDDEEEEFFEDDEVNDEPEANDDSDEEERPKSKAKSKGKPKAKGNDSEDDEEEETPKPKPKPKAKAKPKDSDDEEDETPKSKPKPKSKAKPKDSDDEEETPKSKTKSKAKSKDEDDEDETPKSKTKPKNEDSENDEPEDNNLDTSNETNEPTEKVVSPPKIQNKLREEVVEDKKEEVKASESKVPKKTVVKTGASLKSGKKVTK